jgi:hypothetical protein
MTAYAISGLGASFESRCAIRAHCAGNRLLKRLHYFAVIASTVAPAQRVAVARDQTGRFMDAQDGAQDGAQEFAPVRQAEADSTQSTRRREECQNLSSE